MEIKFSELDYIYEEDAFVIRPDSAINIRIHFAHIEEIHMTHTGGGRRKANVPCMYIKLNTGEEFRIDGYRRFFSPKIEREAFRDFIIDFHKQLKTNQRRIKFTGGINLPKPMSAILAVGGAGLFALSWARGMDGTQTLPVSTIAMVVGLITFFSSGRQYDPNKIPGKYLR